MNQAIEVEIPEAAEEFRFYCADGCGRMGFEVEALPHVVAAELRRIADIYGSVTAGFLKDRASELEASK